MKTLGNILIGLAIFFGLVGLGRAYFAFARFASGELAFSYLAPTLVGIFLPTMLFLIIGLKLRGKKVEKRQRHSARQVDAE